MKYISDQITVEKDILKQTETFAEEGKTPLLFARDGALLGMIAVADTMKEDSPKAIAQLRNMGIRVVMLTGDNEKTARAIGVQAGVDEVIAGVLPDGKESVIRSLKSQGKVAMVGDGINDAPALTRADTESAAGNVPILPEILILLLNCQKNNLSLLSYSYSYPETTFRIIVPFINFGNILAFSLLNDE